MTPNDDVHIFDTKAEYQEIKEEIDEAVARVLSSGRFVGGPEVDAFEEEFGAICGDRSVAACNSGTDALSLALLALGVGAGDEIIMPANTFSATAMAAEFIGATPVICDVDPELHVITAELIEPLITEQTRCILPVHLYGHPCDMREVMQLADQRNLTVVEDAAQAHRASAHGRPMGSWGHAAGFSFYVSKNLGAYGDGGAVAGDPDLVARVKTLRDLGRDPSGQHIAVGINSRLDAIQAAILRVKLRHLATWEERRRRLADRYRSLLADLAGVSLPTEASWARHVYHLFVIRVQERDDVMRKMADVGVHAGIHYPTPIHQQPAHHGRIKVPAGAPVAEKLSREILSLPLYPQLDEAQQDKVVDALRGVVA